MPTDSFDKTGAWRRIGWVTLAVLGAAFLVAVIWIDINAQRSVEPVDPRAGRALTKPLRLELMQDSALNDFLLGLRTFHYRARPVDQARYLDVFYDTEQWDLFKRGYSFRLRTRLEGSRKAKYDIRLEQEPRFVSVDSTKLDTRSNLPEELGDEIVGGAWERALLPVTDVEAPKALQVILKELRIDPSQVRPRLVGELRRNRFQISDKGRNWFELDHEEWSFRLFEEADSAPQVSFEDLVIDTRLSKSDHELIRRVRTMDEFTKMIHGVRPLDRAPAERAIEKLTGG